MKRALIATAAAAVMVAGGITAYSALAAGSDPTASCDPPSYDGTTFSISCTVPQVTATVPGPTVTQTETDTATVTQTVPGPTTTVTETQTVTPTPTTSTPPPPPPSGSWAPGEDVNAGNTGYVGDGVTAAQLVSTNSTTYGTAFNGQTITLKAYHGEVDITGSHITIKDCSLTNGGMNSVGFNLAGSYNTIQNCTITSPAGQSMYEPIWIFGDHNTVLNVDVSRGDNLITTYGTNVTIAGSYLHDTETASDPSDHPDGIEIYGGGPTNIQNNRIHETDLYDSPINAAPYCYPGNCHKLNGLSVVGNFIDNGQAMTLIDNQNGTAPCSATKPVGDCLINTRILGNAFGGHTCPASNVQCFDYYKALENYENRPIVQDDAGLAANPNAIEWPTSGAYVNKWEETQVTTYGDPKLTPNRDDQIALPTCPSPC